MTEGLADQSLDAPRSLGPHTLRNRVVVAAMTTGFASAAGRPTPRLVAWYEARSAGGAGAVIVEETFVLDDPPCRAMRPRHLRLGSDRAIPHFRTLADTIGRAGAFPVVQLSYPRISDLSSLRAGDLGAILAAFPPAARRARQAGFGAVQLQAIPSRLLGQLLSPLFNHRTDHFGHTLDGRVRAVTDLIEEIRNACGPHLPILVKFSADERDPNGITPETAQQIARRLEIAGGAGLEVVGGASSVAPTELLSTGVGEATRADLAATIKSAVNIPVLASGRIVSPDAAGAVLQRGQADFVAIARAALADPAWPAKQRAGVELEIIPCISCMACYTPSRDGTIGCPVNGDAGHEHLPPLTPASPPRRIAVVGASLAGLELARVAAMRGHEVRISTAGLPIGGLLGLRAGVPGDAEFGRAVLYFGDRLRELGVLIVDSPESEADITVDCRPRPERRPAWLRGKATLTAGELLGRDLHEMYGIGRRVAVTGVGALAAEVALFLAGWGRRPTVIVPSAVAAPFADVHPMHAARLHERLDGYKIPLVAGARPLRWKYDEDRRSQLLVMRGGKREWLEPFHSVVCAEGWERASPWPQRSRFKRPEARPAMGQAITLRDTIYPERLRDQVRFAYLLGRVI